MGVIAVHCNQHISDLFRLTSSVFNYGQLGVQLFFVASALTLCLSMSERNESNLMNFYVRRFFRIAPLYYFGIALYFFWRLTKNYYETNILFIQDEYTAVAIVENILFLHGFHPKNLNFVVPGGWSIATEMCFYAIFPLLFSIQKKMGFNRFLKFSIVIALLSFISQFIAIEAILPYLIDKGIIRTTQLNEAFGFIYSSIVNQINVFLIGIITYQILKLANITKALLALGFILCAFSCYLLNSAIFKTGYSGFFYPILSAIAFGIATIKLSKVQKFKSVLARILIRFGQVSFSMYLLHFLFLDILNFAYRKTLFNLIQSPEIKLAILLVSVSLVTYFVARFTYAAIEKPAITFGKRFTL